MSQTGSNHGSNLAEETWVELTRAGSNNESIAVKLWVNRGQIMRRSGSIESEKVEPLVKQGRRPISQTGSNHESNRVNS